MADSKMLSTSGMAAAAGMNCITIFIIDYADDVHFELPGKPSKIGYACLSSILIIADDQGLQDLR